MKTFDINAAIGHWPFRKLSIESLPALKEHLESKGINGAAVSNINGIFYKNCHDANIELYEWLEGLKDFFVGIAIINPAYANWKKDLNESIKKFDFRGVRIVPQYHNYDINSKETEEIAIEAATLKIPLFIPHRLVDIRQCHWMDTEKTVNFEDVCQLCEKFPDTNFILTEMSLGSNSFETGNKFPNLFLETSRLQSSYRQELSKIALATSHKNLLFGSGAPFKEVTPSLLKLMHAELSEEMKMEIASGNALRLLGIKS
jgi:predicted TIM-barrel fold metal-dependent hydrolase